MDTKLEPDLPYSYEQLGMIASRQQHRNEALEYFQHALRLDPTLARPRYQLARLLLEQGDAMRSLTEIDHAVKLAPENGSIHYLRGRILQRLGRTDEAKVEMRTVTGISSTKRVREQQEMENGMTDPEIMQQAIP